jgi:hypothetical protein
MAAAPQPEVTTAQVQAVAFGFYSDEEVSERAGGRERGRGEGGAA